MDFDKSIQHPHFLFFGQGIMFLGRFMNNGILKIMELLNFFKQYTLMNFM